MMEKMIKSVFRVVMEYFLWFFMKNGKSEKIIFYALYI